MAELHLAVADALTLIPQTPGGQPVSGRFPFTAGLDPLLDTYTFALPLQGMYPAGALKGRSYDWAGASTLYLAAHAIVVGEGPAAAEAGVSWSPCDCAFAWEYNAADGYWYYCRTPVAPGQEVKLCLTGCPQKAGFYTVRLSAEGVQALPEAVRNYWGENLPCLQGF